MLYANDGASERCVMETGPHAGAPNAIWLDLVQPTEAERSLAERITGLRVPAQADLEEIESSSRLSSENDVLYLSAPMHYLDNDGMVQAAPVGFVLSNQFLMTVRFGPAPVFDNYAKRFAHSELHHRGRRTCSVGAFVGLLEAIVDRLADVLETLGAALAAISRRVFKPEKAGARLSTTDAQLRATLRSVGRVGERLSNLRDGLLGMQRIVLFTAETASSWIPSDLRPRLKTLRQDIASLNDYDTQLSNKVQFLLDATLGFINIEQNNGIKILTVVSVVGVPPTLVASIYGMNYKWMPELEWEYGYFYGLAVIVASGIIPYVWFKRRGWI